MATATISEHARQRCAEMGISTKVAKSILRHRDLAYRSHDEREAFIAFSDRHPKYAVVFCNTQRGEHVITVVFRTHENYVRDGQNYLT